MKYVFDVILNIFTALGYDYTLPGYKRYKVIGDHGAGEYHLEIKDVQLEDDGEFECQVLPSPYDTQPLRAYSRLTVQGMYLIKNG